MSFELEVAKRMLEEVKSKNSLLLDEYENFKKEIEELKLRHTYLDSIITFKNQKGLNPQAFKEHFGFDELTQNLLKKKKEFEEFEEKFFEKQGYNKEMISFLEQMLNETGKVQN
ncbi:TPA: hypothetical protein ACUNF5_006887 [Burkholderia orbicola]|jgi:predicted RNase H-like nuclease (RuvC/YqgF family)|uniref:hypothetical protein n=1 Tax=Bacillus TaxID=1386 RepID=UPI000BA69027|nr:hypothetical protein [Bacillus licheniformis]AVI47092.1 hypothetical protein BL14DL4_01863 [Bacillus licheniformis]MBS2764302.1 hypothetical protein [Bacillus licheniformis]PAE41433.1 hypothetical protein CHH96_03520 [Bacillus licheniformis]PAE72410.1 hypothetical protein CHH84_10360 [Bacillus licheniformis]QBR21653.1 hypothetical protein EYQ98_19040 [Bacillus licheniformis]